jgi:hypothetical protein
MRNVRLTTVADVLNALGGNAPAAAKLGVKYNSVTNWRTAGIFPANTFVLIQRELGALGYEATGNLWKMRGTELAGKRKARATRKQALPSARVS